MLAVSINTLRPRQNGRHFPGDIFKCIFLNENVDISIKISLKFVHKCPINNIASLVQIMAWRRPGDKPLSEAMMVGFLMHVCVTQPQWVNSILCFYLCHGCFEGIAGIMDCHYTLTPEKYGNSYLKNCNFWIWIRPRRCSCLVTWFCYQLIAKPGNKTAAPSWPDSYIL